MKARFRPIAWLLFPSALLVPFQNCSQKMESAKVAASSSAQCKAQYKAEALQGLNPAALNCGNFNNYACDRRIFSPDVADMSHLLKECLVGGENCVDVEIRQYNTSPVRGAASDEYMFEPGGSYNREEIRCHHRYLYRQMAVFEGEGDSLEEALAAAMKACEKAGESP